MITVTLPKREYDDTQNEIKELKEKIAKILEQKESFILALNEWGPFRNVASYIFVRNFTSEEKEILLTKEIAALNLKLENISKSRDEYCTSWQKSDRLAISRLEMIGSLQQSITQLQVKHKKEIEDLKTSFELEKIKSRPWWKLF